MGTGERRPLASGAPSRMRMHSAATTFPSSSPMNFTGAVSHSNCTENARGARNPAQIRQGLRVWREGDRVIHTRNDYEKEVFNGDMGRIARVYDTSEPTLVVKYPEREVTYTSAEFSDLQPAFAITVHRSQGG